MRVSVMFQNVCINKFNLCNHDKLDYRFMTWNQKPNLHAHKFVKRLKNQIHSNSK